MKKIAVFTSGSDAPGMNACIRSVVRSAHYFDIETLGIMRGYSGMINGEFIEIDNRTVSNIIQMGGSILKCGKCDEFKTKEGRKKAFDNLTKYEIDGLIAIGGTGTFKGAKRIADEFGIPVIGIPGTIDNDVYGTDYTIGYDTAVNTALEAIDQLRDTADSHERVFFIEVMGRDTGFIAAEAAISGGTEMVVMPGIEISIDEIIQDLGKVNLSGTSHIVVVAEENEGQKSKHIADKVKAVIPGLDIRVSTLGHIQRGGVPTSADRVLASQLGLAAIESLIKGKHNVMVGIRNLELCNIPFSEVINVSKSVNEELIRMITILTGKKKI